MRWSCTLALAALAFLGITGTRAAASAYQSSPAADLLSGRAVWKDLPKPFLQALGGKLVTAPVAEHCNHATKARRRLLTAWLSTGCTGCRRLVPTRLELARCRRRSAWN
jgi:hypothetical protein